jgi:hypothetical protein
MMNSTCFLSQKPSKLSLLSKTLKINILEEKILDSSKLLPRRFTKCTIIPRGIDKYLLLGLKSGSELR